jgi:hypothetical protein
MQAEVPKKVDPPAGTGSTTAETWVAGEALANPALTGLPPVFEVVTPSLLNEVEQPTIGALSQDTGKVSTISPPAPGQVAGLSVPISSESSALSAAATGVDMNPVAVDEQSSVDHLLPPQFSVLDPTRLWQQSDGASHILLPTAEGGLQAVSERLVTIEYQGQKYTVIAATPEEKRRRQIIANILSIVVAIAAIVGTIWLLMK